MINLKIDPEFQSQIPPLTDDEFKQLEENILKEGKLLSPLIVWNNTLVDGHNRYAILQKHPEIYFSTMPLPFESREEVLAWICKNQLGRRNLTPEQKKFLMGKQYSSEKRTEAFRGNQHTAKKSGGVQSEHNQKPLKTCERIAQENHSSEAQSAGQNTMPTALMLRMNCLPVSVIGSSVRNCTFPIIFSKISARPSPKNRLKFLRKSRIMCRSRRKSSLTK